MRRHRALFPTLLIALLFFLAACTQAAVNTAPDIDITSPADGTSVLSGEAVVLTADATDAEDGDLSGEVAWSSDIDGALAPDASDEVVLSVGTHTLTATVEDASGETASDTVTVSVLLGTHLVSDGITLRLMAIESGELVEVDTAALPTDGLLDGHQIFNVIAHPSEPWLYAASANECNPATEWCWGNARIDRFALDGDTITHDGAAFLYDASQTEIDCAQDDFGNEGQVGACAPIGMAFSSDATRLYVDDDDFDNVHVFSVDAAGDLAFIEEGASTSVHGLAIDATDSYLYNGSNVIGVDGDTPTDITAGSGGNATSVVELAGGPGLLTTISTTSVAVFDLVDPEVPSSIDQLDFASNEARDLAFVPDLSRIVSVGRDVVAASSFDGTTIALDDRYDATEAFTVEYRGVALDTAAEHAVVAWFETEGTTRTGGVDLFTIGADGALAQVDRVELGAGATVALRLR